MARLALRVLLLALAVGEARWFGPIAVARADAGPIALPGCPERQSCRPLGCSTTRL